MPRVPAPGSRLTAPVAILCLVQFVDVLGVTSVVTAIPAMLDGVGADDSMAGLVATAYAMFFGGLLVLGARLGRTYGHRRSLVAGLALLVAASAVGALAANGWQLVAARSLQGAASAVSVPAAMSLLLSSSPDKEARSRALALWSAAGAAAGAAGFLVGGVLTDLFGWPAVFWVYVPIGAMLAVAVRLRVDEDSVQESGLTLDIPGAALLTSSVMALVLGAAFLEKQSTRLPGAGVLGVGFVGGFLLIRWLHRARDPIISLAALRHRRLLIGVIGSFVNTAATSSAAVLLTLYLQREAGLSPFEAGLMLLPISLAVIGGSAVAAPLVARFSRRLVACGGLGLIAAGNLSAAATLGFNLGAILALVVIGAGLGLSSVACNDIGTDVPERHTSTAIGLLNTCAQLGTAVGVALLILVASPGDYGRFSGTGVALVLAAGVAALTGIALARWTPPPEVRR